MGAGLTMDHVSQSMEGVMRKAKTHHQVGLEQLISGTEMILDHGSAPLKSLQELPKPQGP